MMTLSKRIFVAAVLGIGISSQANALFLGPMCDPGSAIQTALMNPNGSSAIKSPALCNEQGEPEHIIKEPLRFSASHIRKDLAFLFHVEADGRRNLLGFYREKENTFWERISAKEFYILLHQQPI